MTTQRFALPVTWRGADGATAEVPVAYADLAGRLRALSGGADATPALLAAHLRTLGTLAEGRAFETDLVLGGTERPRRIRAELRDPSWPAFVRRMWHAAARSAAGSSTRDGALFLAVPADASHEGYGLHAEVHDGHLLLRAVGGAVARDHLDRLAALYRSALEAAVDGSDPRSPCLPPGERRAVLVDWATGQPADRGEASVVELIAAQARRTPEATAVRLPGGCLTYRELDERANRIAHHLLGLGAGRDAPVGVCLRRGVELLPALLGVWKAGTGYVPLDPGLPAERLARMAGAAGCRLLLSRTGEPPALPGLDGCRTVWLDRDRAAIESSPASPPAVDIAPTQLAYVIYTSGSTGVPKGVMVEHRGLLNYLLWTVEEYAARGTGGSPFFASLCFDLGIPSLYTPLLTGQPVHLLPDPLPAADLGDHLTAGAPYGFVKLTPGQLDLLSYDLTPRAAHGLAGVVVAAGDAFSTDLARRWHALAGPGGTAVATEYGPTEITIGNSGQLVTALPETELVPLGRPIPNTTMYVLTDRLDPVPVGVAGEIYIGGAGVARGYAGDPASTADRFRPDPFGPPGARLYRSGDLGRWLPDGSLEFLGRTDHQVKIRGYRVELGEIRALLREGGCVRDAAVVATGRPPRQQHLAAFVVPEDGRPPDFDRLRADLAARLPDYMIPAHFVAVERIPLTANGKADTGALLDLL